MQPRFTRSEAHGLICVGLPELCNQHRLFPFRHAPPFRPRAQPTPRPATPATFIFEINSLGGLEQYGSEHPPSVAFGTPLAPISCCRKAAPRRRMSIGEEFEKLRDDIVHYLCDSVFAMKTCLFKRLVGRGRFRIAISGMGCSKRNVRRSICESPRGRG